MIKFFDLDILLAVGVQSFGGLVLRCRFGFQQQWRYQVKKT
jgi:hypothetical protein